MHSQLRPMSLGEILDRTAELYRNHFLLFAGTSAIFAGAMLLIEMLHVGVLRRGNGHGGSGYCAPRRAVDRRL